MPICTTCGGFHSVAGECTQQRGKQGPQGPASIDHLFKSVDPADINPDQEQQPLRKRQLNKQTGREDNFIPTYYTESRHVAQMSRDEVDSIRARYEIEVEGDRVPNPITSFREAGLSPDIAHHLERHGFVEPTPIQMQSLPCLLSGRDVVGMAETGSGKTLCYILPMLMFLRTKPPTGPGEGPLVIILAPTRELVEQIYSETIKLMPQVALSINATSATPVPNFAPKPAPAPKPSLAPSSSSSSVSDFARKIQLQKQQLQIKQQQAVQQQQMQQLQQTQMSELQQIQQQQAFEISQLTPEQVVPGITEQHQAQMAQIIAQHQAQMDQLSAEHLQQQQQLLAEHAQAQLVHQQKQLQQQQQAQEDYTLYSQAAANGQYDYSNYNYETAAAYYTQYGAEEQEYQYQAFTPPPVPTNAPPAVPRKVLGVCGGVPLQIQITPLQLGVDILVSTPGRLIDLINKGVCKLDRVSYMVFDEADRMLAFEMEVQLRHIVTQASICVRQSVLFSATFPPAVERLVRSAVFDPIYVRVGSGNKAAEAITQNIKFMHSGEKRVKLLEVLRETPKPPVLIFGNSHHTVDYLVKLLREEQFHAAGLHSDKSQPYRFRVMKAFKDGALDILVATDVASRGIDVSDVTHVILYDLPDNIEDYIHRIGRTGRAGKDGMATAFLTLDCKIADDLRKVLKQAKQFVPPELQNPKQFGGEIVRGELRDYAVKKRMS